MARLGKGQSYDALGFRVDDHGIAYDLSTGRSLSRAEVDSRLSGTDYTNFKHRRGGVAGSYDRNKQWMVPAAEFAAGFIPGVGPLVSAGIGAATGFDREGKSGIGFDLKKGALGGVSGYGLGNLGSMAKSGLGKMFGAGTQTPSPPSSFGAGTQTPSPPSSFGGSVLDFAKKNPNMLASAFGAAAEYPKYQADAAYSKAQADALRRKMEWEEEDRASATGKSDLLAKLLMGGFYGRPTVSG